MLDTLRAEPLAAKTNAPWRIIGSIFENTPYLMSDMRKPIHVAICNLCLKAYAARENALLGTSAPPPSTPAFISQLRQQLEVALIKQQARKDRLQGANVSRNPRPDQASQASGSGPGSTTRVPTCWKNTNHIQPPQANEMAESNSLRYFGFSEDQNVVDDIVMDFDFTFLEDYHLGDATSYNSIDWEQWDSWLAESNLLPSSSM